MNDKGRLPDWPRLAARAALLRRVREFFDARGLLEVETPLLSHDVVIDRHLEPLAVPVSSQWLRCGTSHDAEVDVEGDTGQTTLWLQTSPEFAMKRLLAAGAPSIYQITHAFRGGERGDRHNLEFTIVEWYERDADYAAGRRLLGQFASQVLQLPEAEELSYADAFGKYLGIDPHEATIAELIEAARRHDLHVPDWPHEDRDTWLNWLLAERIEEHLGHQRPLILYDYPASQAALARVRPGPPAVAERFELYIQGVELVNGYHELLDADELRERNRRGNAQRVADGKRPLPENSRLLSAMQAGLPASCGAAVGFDRLVMLATRATRIDQVLTFPIELA